MDLNRCYADHQIALMRATWAATSVLAETHRADARRIAGLIDRDRAMRALRPASMTIDPGQLHRVQ